MRAVTSRAIRGVPNAYGGHKSLPHAFIRADSLRQSCGLSLFDNSFPVRPWIYGRGEFCCSFAGGNVTCTLGDSNDVPQAGRFSIIKQNINVTRLLQWAGILQYPNEFAIAPRI
jgi:hypothetical protein